MEGGNRTKAAQVWPPKLCEAILTGFLEELDDRTLQASFLAENLVEMENEDNLDLGTLDSIQDERDLAPQPDLQPPRLNPVELERQEVQEERPLLQAEEMTQEQERRRKWLKVPRPTRLALRRLHNMTGHGPPTSMMMLLRTAQASPAVIEACKHFACETCRRTQKVQHPNITKMPNKPVFNYEVSIDALEVRDSAGNRHTVLSAVCLGTLFHQCWWVSGGGMPKSSTCAEAFLQGWITPFGPPQILTTDKGVHNQGKFKDLMRVNGIQLRYTGVGAPFQLGRGERQGGLFKELVKTAMEKRSIVGVQNMKIWISEMCVVKNMKLHHLRPSACGTYLSTP